MGIAIVVVNFLWNMLSFAGIFDVFVKIIEVAIVTVFSRFSAE